MYKKRKKIFVTQLSVTKKYIITLTKLLAQAKELDFPRRNVMSGGDLEKAIKDTLGQNA